MYLSIRIEESDNGLILRWGESDGISDRMRTQLFLDKPLDLGPTMPGKAISTDLVHNVPMGEAAERELGHWLVALIGGKRAEEIKKEGKD